MTDRRPAPVWKYIVAWLLSGLLSRIGIEILSIALLDDYRYSLLTDLYNILIIAGLLESTIFFASLMIVYYLFRTLYIDKVLPWLIGLSAVGIVISMLSTASQYERIRIPFPWLYFISVVGGSSVAIYSFYLIFRALGRLSTSPSIEARPVAVELSDGIGSSGSRNRNPGTAFVEAPISQTTERIESNSTRWETLLRYRDDIRHAVDATSPKVSRTALRDRVLQLKSSDLDVSHVNSIASDLLQASKEQEETLQQSIYPFSSYELNDIHRILWSRNSVAAARFRLLVKEFGENIQVGEALMDLLGDAVLFPASVGYRWNRVVRMFVKLDESARGYVLPTPAEAQQLLRQLSLEAGHDFSSLSDMFGSEDVRVQEVENRRRVLRRLLLDAAVGPSELAKSIQPTSP